ncbi:MAG: pyridoxamine kinase [Clostridia bacterium]|nr:pyridoxamine kinase [Clostridia bacterium]
MQKKLLTVQDISCIGQCSMTVAMPIVSSYGIETCILPSAILSTHTGGFKGKFTFRDLTDDFPEIIRHWTENDIRFDALYTGYIGNAKQFDYINVIKDTLMAEGAPIIIDPAMGDNGRLYTGFDLEFAAKMAKFAGGADYVLPNITEAAFMLGIEYKTEYDEDYVLSICRDLYKMGAKNTILTGVSFDPDLLGIAAYNGETDTIEYRFEKRIPVSLHGTGDIFASAFSGALLGGKSAVDAASEAAVFVGRAILNTMDYPEHFYGACFEGVIANKDRKKD